MRTDPDTGKGHGRGCRDGYRCGYGYGYGYDTDTDMMQIRIRIWIWMEIRAQRRTRMTLYRITALNRNTQSSSSPSAVARTGRILVAKTYETIFASDCSPCDRTRQKRDITIIRLDLYTVLSGGSPHKPTPDPEAITTYLLHADSQK